MANQDKEVMGTNAGEGTPETGTEQPATIVLKQKTGIGTTVKIVGGLLVAASLTGLGWILRGIFGGGGSEDDQTVCAEAEHPEE